MDCLVSRLFSARGPPESMTRGAARRRFLLLLHAAVIKLTDDVDLVTLYAPYAPQRDTRDTSRVREPRIAFIRNK